LHSYPEWPFLSDTNHPLASAIWAVFIHGVIGVLVVAPIVWHSRHRIGYGLLAFVGGSVLDLDHVVAAGSISPHALETLRGGRPVTHSLGFVVLLAAVTFAVWPLLSRAARRGDGRRSRWIAAWSVFAVNCAHLLFDAAGHRICSLPPAALNGIPWLLCPVGVLVLMGASFVVDGWMSGRFGRAAARAA
jgi:uncharacterized membrane protein YadS